MVRGLGHGNRCATAKGVSSRCSFSLPRFGYALRRRRISATRAGGHCRCRRRLGAVEPGTKAAGLPASASSFARHRYSVRRLSLNASHVGANPWRCQNLRIASRFWASGAIIPQRKAYPATR
jgi:hypothetical protein